MLPPGEVIAERFEIERPAGSGGMAAVYRARDQVTGETVALKFLPFAIPELDERFAREARILAEIRHPGIVRYVAHGTTPSGASYLAMEWLEGEDLGQRLAREGMTVAESLTVVERAAEAVGVLHAAGIVHRDVKPANLFLEGKQVEKVKVLDLGIAHAARAPSKLTQTGEQIGTPAYMAPEQVRGDPVVGPPADVFALGCVLYECLTGKPLFTGKNALAVMARVVFVDMPSVREARPELPEDVDRLLDRMIDKDPAARPPDGAAVVTALRAIGGRDGGAVMAGRPASALTAAERRLVSVVLAARRGGRFGQGNTPAQAASVLQRLWGAAERYGARMETLLDGTVAALLTSTGWASDLAARAGRCALAVREALPEARIALSTSRAVIAARTPLDEVIDAAATLLDAAPPPAGAVRLDEVTAGLLDTRFEIRGDSTGLSLAGERPAQTEVRRLLGKPTPCVGRERELVTLHALFDECVGEPVARVALLTSAAGVGKSRVRHEFLRELRSREPRVEVWIGRGDPMSAGSPFGLLAQALRGACGLQEGEALAARHAKLRARVARNAPAAEVGRIAEFLGELVGAPFSEENSAALRSARRDPMVLGDQMRRAFEDLVRDEARAQPLVLVLEDLHWGDLPTVKFVDAALRAAHDLPLLVLAVARPEVHDLFPGLWKERELQEIRLGELTRRAGERLVRSALPSFPEALVGRLVERAAGNVFYLEELIRAVAEQPGNEEAAIDAFPPTILAMVQARLEALPAEARRVLRAASVFGQAFWRAGIEGLLGEAAAETPAWLELLQEKELVRRRADARFPGEEEYSFRHAMIREAAYEMLTDDDRALGHVLAGEWLELMGESDALALAEHFERGRDAAGGRGAARQAVRWFRRAAEQAIEGNDLEAAIARAERGVACGASNDELGALRLIQSEAHGWRGEYLERAQCAAVAWQLLAPGSALWYAAAAELSVASRILGHHDTLLEVALELESRPAQLGSGTPRSIALVRCGTALIVVGNGERGDRLVAAADPATLDDPAVAAWVHTARAMKAAQAGDLAASLRETQQSARCFVATADVRYASIDWANVGYLLVELGRAAEAEGVLEEMLADAERMAMPALAASAQTNLALARLRLGRYPEAIAAGERAAALLVEQVDARGEGFARQYLARARLAVGDTAGAAREAERAVVLHGGIGPSLPSSLATLAKVRLAEGRAAEALASSQQAVDEMRALGVLEEGEAWVRLVHVEALEATGDAAAARRELAAAERRLQDRATRISDDDMRRSFLEGIAEHTRTLELALAWGV